MRGPGVVALAALAIGAAIVLTRDPEEAWAVAAVIVALGASAGAIVSVLLLRWSPRGRGAAVRRATAARRGVEVAVATALLLWLRAVDGLSPVTGGFVLAAFVLAEAVLSARPASSR